MTFGGASFVPVVEAAGDAVQRCARGLLLRLLDTPRARSWRLHRRRRRRRVAIWRSRAGGWTVPRRRRLSPSGDGIGLRVKSSQVKTYNRNFPSYIAPPVELAWCDCDADDRRCVLKAIYIDGGAGGP